MTFLWKLTSALCYPSALRWSQTITQTQQYNGPLWPSVLICFARLVAARQGSKNRRCWIELRQEGCMVGYSSYLTQIAGVVSKYIRSSTLYCYTSLTTRRKVAVIPNIWTKIQIISAWIVNFYFSPQMSVPAITPSREKLISCLVVSGLTSKNRIKSQNHISKYKVCDFVINEQTFHFWDIHMILQYYLVWLWLITKMTMTRAL